MDGVLVIEDVRTFRFDCVYARTMGEAWQLLFSKPWREVWFDHDMGFREDSLDTYPLAVRLEEMWTRGQPHPIGRVVVHSSNPTGAERLMIALRHYNPVRVDAKRFLADTG